MTDDKFTVNLVFQSRTEVLDCDHSTTANMIRLAVFDKFNLSEETQLRILLNGKQLKVSNEAVFSAKPKKKTKVIVMATSAVVLKDLDEKRSDPLIRGFEQEDAKDANRKKMESGPRKHWGDGMIQDKNYKFCRCQACTWQDFGHRPSEQTPHAFAAMQLLEKLTQDPGIVAIMKERELVVGTLGEMDPIDDRLMLKKQQEQKGSCLLGYNTNGGARIDIKLRSDDLQSFRNYPDLVSTLIHELSHNWIGEHNAIFWLNYAQMRAEYLYEHARLRSTLVNGTTTAELAGLDKDKLENVFEYIMQELVQEMGQHGLHPNMIADPIRQRCQELADNNKRGKRLGGSADGRSTAASDGSSARDRALAAAERRAREQQKE